MDALLAREPGVPADTPIGTLTTGETIYGVWDREGHTGVVGTYIDGKYVTADDDGFITVYVVRTGVGEWQVSYTAPDAPFAWYWELARQLEAQQWILQNRWSPNSSPIYDPLQPLLFDRKYRGFI